MKKTRVLFLILLLILLGVSGVITMNKKIIEEKSSNSVENRISEETQQLLINIRNEDVIWRGDFFGLKPELTGASLALRDTQENINSFLVNAIVEEDKFVAAHVLLTLRTPETYIISGSEWNGLRVHLQSDGKATFEGNDLVELQKYWRGKLNP
ncbi:hypothetical protein L0244_09755 [bacterium]|nr:hypothetical protein [bacterium]